MPHGAEVHEQSPPATGKRLGIYTGPMTCNRELTQA